MALSVRYRTYRVNKYMVGMMRKNAKSQQLLAFCTSMLRINKY